MEKLIKEYLDTLDLDIRKQPQGYSRFMDQKVTPDVLSFIADCIVNLLGSDKAKQFTVKELWDYSYFVKNASAVFGKPSPTNKTARSEYDKFIAQPLKTLAYSKILLERSVGGRNSYSLLRWDLLEYISEKERNAWVFLVIYVEKVLSDSGFLSKFEKYRDKFMSGDLKDQDFEKLKADFQLFMRGHTKINTNTEINRIFPKILNPYSVFHEIPGSESGSKTSSRFIFPDLMYNRENFRDINKDKTITRGETLEELEERPKIFEYKIQKAKNVIKRHHTSSEVHDSLAVEKATQAHHIFPVQHFPEISDYLENLILLTAQQHNVRAHPGNKTALIGVGYQKDCLLFKIESIEKSIKQGKAIYSKERFIHVLNVGYELELPTTISFGELRALIRNRKSV